MHSLVRSIPLRGLLLEQLPALGASLLITELFFKLHSFTLECLAFLSLWYVFEVVLKQLRSLPSGREQRSGPDEPGANSDRALS